VRGGHLDLRKAFGRLAREGLTEVLVEGGGELAAALLRARLIDEFHWFVAPKLIGGDGRPALASLGLRQLAKAVALKEVRTRKSGDDILLTGSIGDFP
jgi:diaminohydroxyphosphoribosylaminopyrimidine deaminase/5-amino-6-(5-phosphoribosylamino)uracil reductase